MNILDAIEFIYATNGKIFSVHFIKRGDGELREMTCRLRVTKGVNGRGAAYDPAEHGLIPVYDMIDGGWRSIPVENILRVKCGREWIEVAGGVQLAA